MKVCHVTDSLPGYHNWWGGAEQAAYRIIKLLVKNNIENVVLSTKPVKNPKKKEEGFSFYSVPLAQEYFGERFGRFMKRPFDPVAYFASYKLLKKIKPDVLHLHNFANIGFGVILAAKKLKIPVVFSLYDLWCVCPTQMLIKPNGEICTDYQGPGCINCLQSKKNLLQKFFITQRKRIFKKYFFSNLNKIIALANSSSIQLQKYGIHKKKINVVPLPLTVKKLKKGKIEKNSLLFIGWIVRRKGLHILLEAMPKILKKIDVKLYIIGSVDPCEKGYIEKINDIIKKYKLEKKIILLGKKPYKEVEKYLQKSEVIVVPEQWEISLATSLNEAMMFEKSIVASRIGGIPSFLEDDKAGLLAKHDDPDDFAEKIIESLNNKRKAKHMAKKARKDIIKKVSEKSVFEGIIRTYNQVIENK
jgi:glycosyltransferase involved in cell wall biosynthesis